MRVLGVDPGTVVTGWGVVDSEPSRMVHVASGIIRAGRGEIAVRLGTIYRELSAVIVAHEPDTIGLEQNFLSRNVQAAFRLGEARGVVMAAAAGAGLDVTDYAPRTVKKSVAGFGGASKEQMQSVMVRLLAMTAEPSSDEADALAVAVCHAMTSNFNRRVSAALDRKGAR